jgi:hypothetical protein
MGASVFEVQVRQAEMAQSAAGGCPFKIVAMSFCNRSSTQGHWSAISQTTIVDCSAFDCLD